MHFSENENLWLPWYIYCEYEAGYAFEWLDDVEQKKNNIKILN